MVAILISLLLIHWVCALMLNVTVEPAVCNRGSDNGNTIPSLITFYFDGPYRKPIYQNVEDLRSFLPCFNINIVNDDIVIPLLNRRWPQLGAVYPFIKLPSCKSDIARLVMLFEFGGFYVDTHGLFNGKADLFKLWVKRIDPTYEFIIASEPQHGLVNRFMASKRNSIIIYEVINEIQRRIMQHFRQECMVTPKYVPYNIFILTGIVAVTDICNISRVCPFRSKKGISSAVFVDKL